KKDILESIISEQQEAEQSLQRIHESVLNWCEKYDFPKSQNAANLWELFSLVEKGQQIMNRRYAARASYHQSAEEWRQYQSKIHRLQELFDENSDDVFVALSHLKEAVQTEEQHQRELNQYGEELTQIQEKMQALQIKINQYWQECETLMGKAEVSDEDSFRIKARAH